MLWARRADFSRSLDETETSTAKLRSRRRADIRSRRARRAVRAGSASGSARRARALSDPGAEPVEGAGLHEVRIGGEVLRGHDLAQDVVRLQHPQLAVDEEQGGFVGLALRVGLVLQHGEAARVDEELDRRGVLGRQGEEARRQAQEDEDRQEHGQPAAAQDAADLAHVQEPGQGLARRLGAGTEVLQDRWWGAFDDSHGRFPLRNRRGLGLGAAGVPSWDTAGPPSPGPVGRSGRFRHVARRKPPDGGRVS